MNLFKNSSDKTEDVVKSNNKNNDKPRVKLRYILLGIFLLPVAYGMFVGTTNPSAVTSSKPEVGIGEVGHISIEEGSYPVTGITKSSFDRAIQLLDAKDQEGVNQMEKLGIVITPKNLTVVRVIDIDSRVSGTIEEVRFLDGQYKDMSGWMYKEYIKKN